MRELSNYSLRRHNTFGIEAICDRFIEVSTIEEAQEAVRSLTREDMPLLLLGGGSNLLLTRDFNGTVLHSAIKGKEHTVDPTTGDILLQCGSGEVWDDIVAYSIEHDWYGAENLSLIPGEAGASAVQNIGAYGVEAKDIIEEVEGIEISTGNLVRISNKDCNYAYRDSRFKHDWRDRYFITHVTYRLKRVFHPKLEYGNIRSALEKKGITNPDAKRLRETIIEIRKAKLPDPKEIGNAGSFFMNPVVPKEVFEKLQKIYPDMPHYTIDDRQEKIPAGWMIEQCGWKGKSLGRAGVYERQALVLINKGGASGQEVVALYQRIIHDVQDKFGIEIHPEVNVK